MTDTATDTDPAPGFVGHLVKIANTAAPLYVSMIVSSAAALVDTAVLGRHATATLAAFGVTMAVYGPATAAIAGSMRGVMPFVTEHADRPVELKRVVRNGFWLGVATGLLGAVAVALVPLIGRAGGVPRTTLDQLGALPWLLALSALFTAIDSAASATLIGLDRAKVVMRAGLAGTAAALVLSPLLVIGIGPVPSLGLAGAGVAMAASTGINAAVAQVALRRMPKLRQPATGPVRVREVVELARVGLPLATTVLIKFAVLGVLAFVAARVSTQAAAAHSVALSLVNLMFTAAVAVGQATIPLVAERHGAGDLVGLRLRVRAGLVVSGLAVVLLGGLLVAVHGPVLGIFSSDPVIHTRVTDLLPLILLAVLADALQALLGFGMIGVKRTFPSMVCFAVCYGVLALVAGPAGSLGGLTALWATLAVANLVLVAAQGWCFLRQSALAVATVRVQRPVPVH
ncbi:multidrug resistance protein, MATE family [Streptomyces sp. TLI_053]|uniref:MATE family efflux transporter n=1 Tax=Streptomyces sp. TLI_053 TaxID=1855352 RepID=UPI00087A666D|nr:MATE family efflux transporter [Streptomyces sp. TLI_053]SDT83261.1 multidrug resistance protein, MATE family [Streptomyces sp. TLI_053]